MSTEKPWTQRQPLAHLTRGLAQRVAEGLHAMERSYRATVSGVRPGMQVLRQTCGLPPLSQKDVMAHWRAAMADKPERFSLLGDRGRARRVAQSRRLRKGLRNGCARAGQAQGATRLGRRLRALSEARLPRAARCATPYDGRRPSSPAAIRRPQLGRGNLAH